MENFNRIVSFVLGLIVVIVFLAAITGRLNLKSRLQSLTGKPRVTPTVSVAPFLSPSPEPNSLSQSGTTTYKTNAKTPTTIPATGSPTLLLPVLFSSLSLGFYLRKKI